MSAIHVLDRSVAERIAAGEVVERPASVVKELIENSLDAGARSIGVEVEGAGLRMVRVADDGMGIAAAEVAVAFQRFATSKITAVEDLDAVTSFGFRGEALPSIAAVARVVMTTRPRDAEHATRIMVAGGDIEAVSSHGAPHGTTVEVTGLFFNTPARLKFLKSPAREQALIADTVQRAAMANPETAFRLSFDGREAARWPRVPSDQRVADLLGAGGPSDLVVLAGRVPDGTLSGWLARPDRSRPTRAGQHVFVNRRPVQSALLRRAVEQGYAQLLPVGRLPVFAVFLEIAPASVDVNVHPRKLEVRFREEGRLFAAVSHHTRDALRASPLIRGVALVPPVSALIGEVGAQPSGVPPGVGEMYQPAGSLLQSRETGLPYALSTPGRLPSLRPIGQLLGTYVLAESPDGLCLIDQHAAHERVLYERIVAARRRGDVPSQMLAVPLTLELLPSQMALLAGHLDALDALGYAVEPFGAHTVLLRAVPALSSSRAPDALLRRVLSALADESAADDTLERCAIATACHTAIRAGDRLTADGMTALVADLAATDDPFTCFHGRPTIVAVSRDEIGRWFLRT